MPITLECADRLELVLATAVGGGPVISTDWSFDGQQLFVVTDAGDVSVLDSETLAADTGGLFDIGGARAIAASPAGDYLAVGLLDGTVHVFDMRGSEVFNNAAHSPSAVAALAWSTDGRLLASGGGDNRVRIFLSPSFLPSISFVFGYGPVASVDWSPNQQFIAAGGYPMNLTIWLFLPYLGHFHSLELKPDPRTALAWLHNSDYLASAGIGIHVFQVSTAMERRIAPGTWFISLAASPVDNLIVAGGGEPDEGLYAIDPLTGETLASIELGSPVNTVAFSPAGDRLAAGLGDGSITLWQCPRSQ